MSQSYTLSIPDSVVQDNYYSSGFDSIPNPEVLEYKHTPVDLRTVMTTLVSSSLVPPPRPPVIVMPRNSQTNKTSEGTTATATTTGSGPSGQENSGQTGRGVMLRINRVCLSSLDLKKMQSYGKPVQIKGIGFSGGEFVSKLSDSANIPLIDLTSQHSSSSSPASSMDESVEGETVRQRKQSFTKVQPTNSSEPRAVYSKNNNLQSESVETPRSSAIPIPQYSALSGGSVHLSPFSSSGSECESRSVGSSGNKREGRNDDVPMSTNNVRSKDNDDDEEALQHQAYEQYKEHRRRNNASAKKSRDARKEQAVMALVRAHHLEMENQALKAEIFYLRNERVLFQRLLLDEVNHQTRREDEQQQQARQALFQQQQYRRQHQHFQK